MAIWLHELAWPKVRDYLQKERTILIPVGAIEQHGMHLPLQTDAALAIDVAVSMSDETGTLICPPVWFGWSHHHMGYPGTVTLRAETFICLLEDIGQSLLYHGFDKLVFINGNRMANMAPMEIAAVRLRNRYGAYVAIIDTGLIARRELSALAESALGGLSHAGESETSLMLHNHPDLVRVDLAGPTKAFTHHEKFGFHHIEVESSLAERDSFTVKPTVAEMTEAGKPTGAHGDPSKASAVKGAQFHAAIVKNALEALQIIQVAKSSPTHEVDVPV